MSWSRAGELTLLGVAVAAVSMIVVADLAIAGEPSPAPGTTMVLHDPPGTTVDRPEVPPALPPGPGSVAVVIPEH